VTFKIWEILKNASVVTVVPKNIFSPRILNFVQSFVECKVSLADGSSREADETSRKLSRPPHFDCSLTPEGKY
jgi:hypothetical protein